MLPEAQPKARLPRPRSAAADKSPEFLIGQKVSILYRLPGDPEHPFSEAVGVVRRVDGKTEAERVLQVQKRDGTVLAVALADIVKMKVVPPPQ